ncbi:MAG: MFS transporter [Candidatus Lokiarchaeota archaeon]|nr:MFS transporter [Candidatus Lokiarchaeota archaeon]MBD3341036.1 MFS transporter [Candidatus Lokiarchaeota archaeon]
MKMNEKNEMKHSSTIHWSYGLGGFLTNFILVAMGVRLIFYYENVLLLDIVLIGLALTILGFWNMVNDPLMGYLSDKDYAFTKRWGRRFPWFLVSSILCCLFYFLIFAVPFTTSLGMFLWLVITSCIFELLYSTWNTNYIALFPEKFRSEKERTKVAGINTITGQFGVALGIVLPPLIIISDQIDTYIKAAIIVAILSLIVAIMMIPGMLEKKNLRPSLQISKDKNGPSFFESLKYIFKQKNLSLYLYAYLAHQVLTFMMLASFPYWTVYIIQSNDPTIIEIILAGLFLIGGLLSVPFWIKIGRKLGNRKGFIYGMLSTSLFFIPLLFVSNPLLTSISIFLLGIGIGSIWTLLYPAFSDVVDENILLTNKRQEGIYNGIRMLIGRFGMVINAIAFALVHSFTNYRPNAASQSATALLGIRILMAFIPMMFYLSAGILMLLFYDLTPDKVARNQALLKERGL